MAERGATEVAALEVVGRAAEKYKGEAIGAAVVAAAVERGDEGGGEFCGEQSGDKDEGAECGEAGVGGAGAESCGRWRVR